MAHSEKRKPETGDRVLGSLDFQMFRLPECWIFILSESLKSDCLNILSCILCLDTCVCLITRY